MVINKIFHLHQPLPKARESLRKLDTWSASEKDIHCSVTESEGLGHVEFQLPQSNPILADIQEVPGQDPTRILFRSVRGNLELAGLIDLVQIRPNLTEAVLTLDYQLVSPIQKAVESVDRFLNRLLARIEICMHTSSAVPPPAISQRFT